MPVNKHIGKLWFETQEEADDYDDRNLAHMELKSSDFENEHFAIMSLRERREQVPLLTPKAQEQIQNYEKYMTENAFRKPPNTLDACWEFPIFKFNLGLIGSYLILRELPIRNFYARSFAMFFYLNYLRKILRPDWVNGTFNTGLIFESHPDHL
jgi:hypothetical protein